MNNTDYISDEVNQSSHHHHHHSHSHSSKKDNGSALDNISHIVISLVLIVITLILTLNYSLFNSDKISNSFDVSSYTDGAYKEIVLMIKTAAAKNGIPYKTLENLIDSERVRSDVTQYISSININESTMASDNIKTDDIVADAYDSIVTYASKNGTALTENKTEKIQSIAKNIGREYKKIIAMENFEKFLGFSSYFDVVKSILLPICVVLLAAFSYVWIKDNFDHKHRLLRKYGGVCGTTGFVACEFSIVLYIIGVFKHLSFTSTLREYMAFTSYFRSVSKNLFVVGIVWIIAMVMLVVFWKMAVDKSNSKS